MSLFPILGWIFTGLGLCGAAYALLAAWFAGRFVRAKRETGEVFPPLTLLKPLHGAGPSLEADLETFFRQDYPAPLQLVFGVHDKADAAVAVVEKLRARYPAMQTVLAVEERPRGSNPKISNLIAMQAAAQHELLVLSDADISVEPDYLSKIAAALAPAEVGAVTCLYTGWAAAGFASQLEAMGITYQFLPNVLAGLAFGLAAPCFGSTIAIKKTVLERIGGFAAFADKLADDHEIGRAVRASGRRVVFPAFAVRHASSETILGGWLRHELRWMRTIRTVDPAGHFGSFITQPIPLALAGTICAGFTLFSLAALGAAFLARAGLKMRIDAAFGGAAGSLWLLPIRDVLSFGVFLMSLSGGTVVWQNRHLRVRQDGALSKR
jgi:ceramide glucosyltransferase